MSRRPISSRDEVADAAHRVGLGQVAGLDMGGAARCADARGDLFERLAPPAGQHDRRALLGQHQRRRLADAAAAAGHPDDLALAAAAPCPPLFRWTQAIASPREGRDVSRDIAAVVVIASAAKQSRPEFLERVEIATSRSALLAMTGEHHADPHAVSAAADRRRPASGRRPVAEACPELEVIVAGDARGRRAGDRAGRGRLRHDPAGAAAARRASALAAGAAGGAAGRVLLPRADRAPGRRSPISARSTTTTSPRTS